MTSTHGENLGGDSTGMATGMPGRFSESTERKTESQKRKGSKKTTEPDTGLIRGNRAAPLPQRLYKPDVDTYLEHLANHGHVVSFDLSTSQHSSCERILENNGRGSTFVPRYAGRSHGELIPGTFRLSSAANKNGANDTFACVDHDTMITEEVWRELVRENSIGQSVQRRGSFSAKETVTRRRLSSAETETLRRALKDRGNSGVNY